MPQNVDRKMIDLLNGGDKRELRAFLTLYAKPIYDRAYFITKDEAEAKRVTRRTVSEVVMLAAKGQLEYDVDEQLMRLTDSCCSEDIFLAKLVDDTMAEMAGELAPPAPKRPAQAEKPQTRPIVAGTRSAAGSSAERRRMQEEMEQARAAALATASIGTRKTVVTGSANVAASEPENAPAPQKERVRLEYSYHGQNEQNAETAASTDGIVGDYRDTLSREDRAHNVRLVMAEEDPEEEAQDAPVDFGEDIEKRTRTRAKPRSVKPRNHADAPELELFGEDDEEETNAKPSPWLVILIFVLSLVTVALVWVLVVKLMTMGVLPKFDFGFADWFNANVFQLY